MRAIAASLVLMTMLIVPPAAADPAADLACSVEGFLTETAEACTEIRDPTRAATAALCAATTGQCEPPLDVSLKNGWGTYYFSLSPPGVYRETNGCAGFQPHASACGEADAFLQPLRVIPHDS